MLGMRQNKVSKVQRTENYFQIPKMIIIYLGRSTQISLSEPAQVFKPTTIVIIPINAGKVIGETGSERQAEGDEYHLALQSDWDILLIVQEILSTLI
ncbi:MAG: hypothetical protein CO137_02940 [Candidatus Magasanikbacteria bacterium CG_4_9_14_3_um_filter_32_9]|uniref:Uncharacterized protein n=1 Tax=Candidatus Magasanikbacteria bacterium CG_4_9_14_3_um_filter_32_9 TaxID=1974644 RepID=A0A2M7Z6I2_9BACT|nr:MAG: hypothetical protein CO137_02940 [Candidatus Magasanikbacteria bacterium CG_4_9_14_3_um_filter_32_9]